MKPITLIPSLMLPFAREPIGRVGLGLAAPTRRAQIEAVLDRPCDHWSTPQPQAMAYLRLIDDRTTHQPG
jgi:hypothetical protein